MSVREEGRLDQRVRVPPKGLCVGLPSALLELLEQRARALDEPAAAARAQQRVVRALRRSDPFVLQPVEVGERGIEGTGWRVRLGYDESVADEHARVHLAHPLAGPRGGEYGRGRGEHRGRGLRQAQEAAAALRLRGALVDLADLYLRPTAEQPAHVEEVVVGVATDPAMAWLRVGRGRRLPTLVDGHLQLARRAGCLWRSGGGYASRLGVNGRRRLEVEGRDRTRQDKEMASQAWPPFERAASALPVGRRRGHPILPREHPVLGKLRQPTRRRCGLLDKKVEEHELGVARGELRALLDEATERLRLHQPADELPLVEGARRDERRGVDD
mmetsp:Transcript_10450/g.25153  ORF Transcript_10450/g.25153 Transcript_10450/m.25153 type:complete len:330 (+) Transcript_10450:135-1124(+)